MKLARREKYYVYAGAVSIGIFLFFQFLISPFFDARARVRRGVEAKEAGLEEIMQLSSEYKRYRRESQGIEQILAKRTRSGFTLFSYLEKAAGEAGVKAHIKYMRPSTSSGSGPNIESLVEMKLDGITLEQLVGYLYRIESPVMLVIVKRISIQENKRQAGYLDAILQVMTFQG
jgi:general secretion pathway protein M